MRILCIGCSWTEGWPHHLPESFNFHKSSLHGLGLGKIKQTFEDKGFERKPRTAIRKLMKEYKDIILEINKLHPNVVFFLYNTGGYPLRHPFDFGKDIDKKFIEFFRENERSSKMVIVNDPAESNLEEGNVIDSKDGQAEIDLSADETK